ncbi:MAG: cation:proton antiporter, partial [Planctomycetota bacterium]|nr:cation:proton antiporter [Planctomycetota bacterium]
MQSAALILAIAATLAAALFFGWAAHRMRLSPIVGYLLAGALTGPYLPAAIAGEGVAQRLADIGIVLLMFDVGIRFRLGDLWQVRAIALPGAIMQSALATALAAAVLLFLGWRWQAALAMGVAISVASTVVLTRSLREANLLDTPQARVAVGWTIVEDLITIGVLVALPLLALANQAGASGIVWALALALGKAVFVGLIIFFAGSRAIPRLLTLVARSRLSELFTLCVLVIALGIASAASLFFGVSLALGAFLAGVAVGYSRLSVQAAAEALPLRDAFAALFFVSVGMMFDSHFFAAQATLLCSLAAIVLVYKPLGAILIAIWLGASVRTALVVGLCLAQIGEFSFVMAQTGRDLALLPPDGYSTLVSLSLVSITLNPLWLRFAGPLENFLRRRQHLWQALNRRARREAQEASADSLRSSAKAEAIIVGYGPTGRAVAQALKQAQARLVIVDLNPETVRELAAAGEPVVYGNACSREVLLAAGVPQAKWLIVTLPDILGCIPVIVAARLLNPEIIIITRARYLQERTLLAEVGATIICTEEAEIAIS